MCSKHIWDNLQMALAAFAHIELSMMALKQVRFSLLSLSNFMAAFRFVFWQ
jgi:hypothetical protein